MSRGISEVLYSHLCKSCKEKVKKEFGKMNDELRTMKDRALYIKGDISKFAGQLEIMIGETSDYNELLVSEVRRAGILDELFEKGGVVSKTEFYDIGKRWGVKSQGMGGFSSIRTPLVYVISDDKRALAEKGEEIIREMREEYGDEWRLKIDMDYIGNKNTTAGDKVLVERV